MIGRLRDHRGSAATELVLVTPLLLLLVLFVVFLGRLSTARQDVNSAARDAARAASLRADQAAAVADAEAAAEASFADLGTSCSELRVNVDTTQLRPGGSVGVEVICTADLSDLALLRVPGTRTVSADAREVVDAYGLGS